MGPKFVLTDPNASLTSAAVQAQAYQPPAGSYGYGGYRASPPALGTDIPQYGQKQQEDQKQGTFFKNADGSLNSDNLQLILGGIGTIGNIWNSFQQNKLAKKSLALQTKAFETNLANQKSTYNTSLEDRIRARYATEGRSDQANTYINDHKL